MARNCMCCTWKIAYFVNADRQKIIGCMFVWGVDVPKWTFELSSRSLLLASCNRNGLAVNFDNTWAKQKYHVPNPSVNKETWGKDTYNWSCVVLLHVVYLDWEDWLPGIPESRGTWKEGLPLRRYDNGKEKEAYEEEGKDPGWRKPPGICGKSWRPSGPSWR